MRATLDYLDEQYGGVTPYLHKAGLAQDELDRLRNALVE
jgi:hypothetical protein